MALILVIDQGTTGSQVSIFESAGFDMLSNAKVEFPQHFPAPGHVEHNADEIWLSVANASKLAFEELRAKHPNYSSAHLAAIGITNQRETVLAWHRDTGQLAGNAIVWQDRRTEPFCKELRSDNALASEIYQKTGLVLDPYFSASKMRWMLKHYPLAKTWAREGKLCLGTIDAYLIFKLTNGSVFATEHTNASRTQLYNLHSGHFDSDLLRTFDIPGSALPALSNSSGKFGTTSGVGFLPDGIPITGCLGDQQSALFGQLATSPGDGKITYGTGAFILLNCGDKIPTPSAGLLATVAYSSKCGRTFALEGSAFIAGAAIQFIRDNFGWIKSASDCEKLALSEPRDPHLFFIPALTGLGAPYWNADAKGALLGLSRGSSKAQIMRAVLESIALQNVQILRTMEDSAKIKIQSIGVDGGAASNDYLMQFQADALRVKLTRPENVQTTSKGAAFAAYLGYNSDAKTDANESQREFLPSQTNHEVEACVSGWLRAVEAINRFYSDNQRIPSR